MNFFIEQPQFVVKIWMFLFSFCNIDSSSDIFRQGPILFIFPGSISNFTTLTWYIRFFLRFWRFIFHFRLIKSYLEIWNRFWYDIFFRALWFYLSLFCFVLWILNKYVRERVIFADLDFSSCFVGLLLFYLVHYLFQWRRWIIHIDSIPLCSIWWSSSFSSREWLATSLLFLGTSMLPSSRSVTRTTTAFIGVFTKLHNPRSFDIDLSPLFCIRRWNTWRPLPLLHPIGIILWIIHLFYCSKNTFLFAENVF